MDARHKAGHDGIRSILAIPDRRAAAGFLNGVLGDRDIGDLLEGKLLVRREIAIIDVVLVRPFGALAHEAFVRCVGRFAHLRAHHAFDAYLRRAIVNLHTSGIRHRYAERDWLRREGPGLARATASLPDVAGREDLWRALGTLPARQRAALVLRYYEDLSENDTAGVLGCSVAAVKSLVARGSETLRTTIAQGEDR